jgi:hypothetical protein
MWAVKEGAVEKGDEHQGLGVEGNVLRDVELLDCIECEDGGVCCDQEEQ